MPITRKPPRLCVCVSLSLFHSVCLSVSPSLSLYVFHSVCLSVCLSVCPSLSLYVCLSVCLSVSLCLSLSLSVSLSLSLSPLCSSLSAVRNNYQTKETLAYTKNKTATFANPRKLLKLITGGVSWL